MASLSGGAFVIFHSLINASLRGKEWLSAPHALKSCVRESQFLLSDVMVKVLWSSACEKPSETAYSSQVFLQEYLFIFFPPYPVNS